MAGKVLFAIDPNIYLAGYNHHQEKTRQRNRTNSIKFKNFPRSTTPRELEKFDIDWLVYFHRTKCTMQGESISEKTPVRLVQNWPPQFGVKLSLVRLQARILANKNVINIRNLSGENLSLTTCLESFIFFILKHCI